MHFFHTYISVTTKQEKKKTKNIREKYKIEDDIF